MAREELRSRPCPRILTNGVLEYWRIGVLCFPRIAPRRWGCFRRATPRSRSVEHPRFHLPTSRLHRLSERPSISLPDLLSLSTSVITALVISRSPNLHRLVPLDHVNQGLLPMKQLLGGTHLGRYNSISSPKANTGDGVADFLGRTDPAAWSRSNQ